MLNPGQGWVNAVQYRAESQQYLIIFTAECTGYWVDSMKWYKSFLLNNILGNLTLRSTNSVRPVPNNAYTRTYILSNSAYTRTYILSNIFWEFVAVLEEEQQDVGIFRLFFTAVKLPLVNLACLLFMNSWLPCYRRNAYSTVYTVNLIFIIPPFCRLMTSMGQ